MRDLPDNVLGISATEKITGADYETILIPALEKKLQTNPKLRMLYHIATDFEGFEFSAIWDDAKLGMQHLSEWDRVALVSDHNIINSSVKFFVHLIKAQIKIFKGAELDEAKEWIAEQ
jgi:hypothetical protein